MGDGILVEFGSAVNGSAPRFSPAGASRWPMRRFPARWKDSRQINMLEQILIAKVFNFGGICSSHP
jgi:hypothetical protein